MEVLRSSIGSYEAGREIVSGKGTQLSKLAGPSRENREQTEYAGTIRNG
jgi:hypothetical protein